MATIMVWMLISSGVGQSTGLVSVVGHFKTSEMCEHVGKSMQAPYHRTSCIKAEVVKP